MSGRVGAVTALGALAAVIAIVLLWPTTRAGSEPIAHGSDVCARCRMIIGRPGFAGELRDHKGALTKYDDLGCMLETMLAERGEMPEAWVEDYAAGELVPLLGGTLVRVDPTRTPMGHGIVAFADADAARAFAAEQGGEVVALEDLVRDRRSLALGASRGEPEGHP